MAQSARIVIDVRCGLDLTDRGDRLIDRHEYRKATLSRPIGSGEGRPLTEDKQRSRRNIRVRANTVETCTRQEGQIQRTGEEHGEEEERSAPAGPPS